jgi:hypothetical protein
VSFLLFLHRLKFVLWLLGLVRLISALMLVPPSPLIDKCVCVSLSMGFSLRQGVSDDIFRDFVDGVRDIFVVQSNDYYERKLRGKKYLILVNEGDIGGFEVRFLIKSIVEGYGGIHEDVYGQYLTGPHLKIKLKKREKTG